jgi:hypothetical protein
MEVYFDILDNKNVVLTILTLFHLTFAFEITEINFM